MPGQIVEDIHEGHRSSRYSYDPCGNPADARMVGNAHYLLPQRIGKREQRGGSHRKLPWPLPDNTGSCPLWAIEAYHANGLVLPNGEADFF